MLPNHHYIYIYLHHIYTKPILIRLVVDASQGLPSGGPPELAVESTWLDRVFPITIW